MLYRFASLAVIAVVVSGCIGQPRRLLHATDPATDFYQVSDGIYRGGRLDGTGVDKLAKLGVKTILNLENDDDAIADEALWAKRASITQISAPMSGYQMPRDRQVDSILAVLADPSKRPIYVHCKKGMDRTGIVIALHRVINEGWTTKDAVAERDRLGFNNWLVVLDRYYARRIKQFALAAAQRARLPAR